MKEDSNYLEAKEALLKSGWQNEDLLFEQVMYAQGRLYHFDIVLLYNLFPLAVVEIKRNIVSPELVDFSAREFAEILGVPFALVTDKTRTLVINTQSGRTQTLVDFPTPKDLWITMGREWGQSDPRLYPPYLLEHRDFGLHQAIAVGRVIEAILNGQRRILLAMTIGTGRSWVLFQVAWKLVQSRYYRRILYLTELVLLREQAEKRFKALDQNLLILSKTHPAHASAHVHMATVSQLHIEETYNSLLSLPSDFYDLIILEDIRYEKGLLPILDHFSMATRIALDNIGTSTISRDYTPVFTYTGHDVFETEYAQPPAGFLATRLMDIAGIRVGKRYKKSSSGANNTPGPSTCYLITPSNIQVDGSLQPDAKSIIERVDLDEQLTLKPDDILLATFTTGAQNRVALVSGDFPEAMTFNQSLIRIRVDRQCADPKLYSRSCNQIPGSACCDQ
jgi:type III restriction/modification enzyme restriction subunit